MAKIKAEYLYKYHTKKGYPLRSYLFGHIGAIYKMASIFPKFANFVLETWPMKSLLSFFGITSKRSLPHVTAKRFSHYLLPKHASQKKIVFFNDTFTEFVAPHIGIKAVDILDRLGFEVIIPPYHCCGRTLISKGLLPQAKKKAQKLIELLFPYAEQNIIICGVEPSCLLTLRDEFRDFHLDEEKVQRIVAACRTIDEVIADSIDKLVPELRPPLDPILVHGHCHQKALVGMGPTMKILKSIPHARVHEIPSGCCGMAGSFGYEKEYDEISKAIGELILFPEIRHNKQAIIVANGTSCRSQIKDVLNVRPMHLVELLSSLLK
jgi:Fe-S oxidoreductase